jgi:hypothetical protein
MTNLERRINLIEARLQILENSKSSKKVGSNHVGKKTKEVLAQEIKALFNSYKPETSTDAEKDSFLDEFSNKAQEISKLSEKEQTWIAKEVKEFQTQIEKIQNS